MTIFTDNFTKNDYLNLQFYIHSLSLFLQSSFGIKDRVKIYLSILSNVNDLGKNILNRLNIYISDTDYFTVNNIKQNSNQDVMLDIIGNIFNLNRTLLVTLQDGTTTTRTLTNLEFLNYIKIQTLKLVFDGSNTNLLQLYLGTSCINYNLYVQYNMVSTGSEFKYNLDILKNKDTYSSTNSIQNLGVYYLWTDSIVAADGNNLDSLEAKIFVNNQNSTDFPITTDSTIGQLFLNGQITIESIGVTYEKQVNLSSRFALFTDVDGNTGGVSHSDATAGRFYNIIYQDPSITYHSIFADEGDVENEV